MKHFTFRLFLIRKLIESLMSSCIDEYTEFEDIADGLAKAHSAMERKRRPEPVDPELVERMKLLAKHGYCYSANKEWESSGKNGFCAGCIRHKCGPAPRWWNCNDEQKSAKRWLAEHGIKE